MKIDAGDMHGLIDIRTPLSDLMIDDWTPMFPQFQEFQPYQKSLEKDGKIIKMKFPGKCRECGNQLYVGDRVKWFGKGHVECLTPDENDQRV
jgi:hypothetical protein